MSTENRENPQIFVDEDWKSRVESEKKAAAERTGEKPSATDASPSGSAATAEPEMSQAETPRTGPLPEATLSFLVTTLATQAMVSLGMVPNPFSGKTEIRLPEARHFIDALTMLEEKTTGNRTPEESALLDGFLHQLRMAYIEAMSATKTSGK